MRDASATTLLGEQCRTGTLSVLPRGTGTAIGTGSRRMPIVANLFGSDSDQPQCNATQGCAQSDYGVCLIPAIRGLPDHSLALLGDFVDSDITMTAPPMNLLQASVRSLVVILMCTVTGCQPRDPGESTSAQGLYSISITGMDLLGAFPVPNDWGNGFGSLTFEAYGAFPVNTGLTYRAHVICDGKEWPSIIVPGWGPNQIDISIPNYQPEYPPGTACWFMFELSDPSNRASASYSNVFGPLAPLVITDGLDDGVSGGQHMYTLRGPGISSTGTYSSHVTCGGFFVPSSLISQINGSADIQFASSSSPRSCSLRLATSAGLSSAWTIRDGGSAPSAPANLGAYFWGGHQPDTTPNALGHGVMVLNQAGFGNTVRLVVYPGMRLPGIDDTRMGASTTNTGYFPVYSYPDSNPYILTNSFCPPGSTSFLECALRSSDFQQAFSNVNNGGTIVLTALDAASNGDYGYCATLVSGSCITDESYLTQNADEIKNEYRDATFALYQTQHDTNKTFVIDNWETDNIIYCDGAGGYAASYHANSVSDCNSPVAVNTRISGLKKWFQLRQAGIQAGIALAHDSNYSGVTVVDAIEMASTHWLQDIGAPNTLDDIVSTVVPGFVSYSAWDSTLIRGTLDEDLGTISAKLATFSTNPITGHRPYLILGELGIPDPDFDAAHAWRNVQTVEAAYRANVPRPTSPSPGPPSTVMWQAFTPIGWNWQPMQQGLLLQPVATINSHQGMFFSNGEERIFATALRSELINYASTAVLPPQSTSVGAIADLGVTSGLHYFELWGAFPNPAVPYSVTVTCDGTNYSAVVYYQNTNSQQLNIYIPDPGSGTCPNCGCGGHNQCYSNGQGCVPMGRWCTFSVKQSGTTGSPTFGPHHVCPGTQGSGIPYPQGQDWQGQCTTGIGGC